MPRRPTITNSARSLRTESRAADRSARVAADDLGRAFAALRSRVEWLATRVNNLEHAVQGRGAEDPRPRKRT